MGMDVYGVGNREAYFRANIWSWFPLLSILTPLMEELEIDEATINGMQFNEGAGIEDPKKCKQLASLLEDWIVSRGAEHSESFSIDSDIQVDEQGRFLPSGEKGRSAYWINIPHIKEFVDFLKECKGFQVF